ncbi:MAG: sigma-70 family RNA polymerase sigma factor [Gemmatales bacterium]|nr:sigma-70 family RNA polymerase sigma factor [Gemmatales bacterium]
MLPVEERPTSSLSADADLLQRFTEQADTLAFAQLVQKYARLVWRICYRVLGHHQDAEDAFQATFLILATQARTIRKPEQLADWLHGVALRISWKARTMRQRRRRREAEAARWASDQSSTDVADGDAQALVHRELSKLPQHFRTVLVLCDLQGLTRQQAAQQLGLPEGTIASRLARGRALLARRLRQAGLPVAAGLLAVPIQDALAQVRPHVISATLELAGAMLAGKTASYAGSTAYILAQNLLRSLTMMRVGLWTMVAMAVLTSAMITALGWATLLAQGDSQGFAPPPPDEVVSPSQQQADAADRDRPSHAQQQNGASDVQTAKPAEPRNDAALSEVPQEQATEYQLAQGPQQREPVAAPAKAEGKPAAAPADRWTHRQRWENVEVPVAVAMAPAGDYFALADAYGYVKLYSLKEEKPRTVREPRKEPRDLVQPVPPGGGGAILPFGAGAQVKVVSREERIWDLAFSPSGTLLAVACGAREQQPRVEVFSLQRQQDKDEWKLHQQVVLEGKYEPRRVAFSPDGKQLFVGGFGRVLASYDVASGKLLRDWTPLLPRKELGEVRDLQVSPSGKYLAVTVLWQPPLPKNLGQPGGRAGVGIGAGPALETALRTSLVVFDLEKGERRWFQETTGKTSPFQPQLAVYERVALSSDESLIAAMRMDAHVVVMELHSGKVLSRFRIGEDRFLQAGQPNVPGGKPPAGVGIGGAVGGALPRSVGMAASPDYWELTTSTPLVFFDPPSGRLVTWDYYMPGLAASPRLWDAKTGKPLGQWDVALQLRIGGNLAPKTIGMLGGETGRFIIVVEPQPAGGGVFGGGGFFGGGNLGPAAQPGQTNEDQVMVFPAVVHLYTREDSLK